MANLDAATLGQHAQRLGLVTEAQLQDVWDEVGKHVGDPQPLLLALERKGYLTPWQSQKLLKGDRDGYFLGGCRVLYKIASGSFGRVFRAEEVETGRVVAIKVLRRRWSDDAHNIELFEREGKVGLTLQHPHIVEVLNVRHDAASGQYYIVMEFVEGQNLRDFLAIRKKLEPAEALHIIAEAAAGLAHAYSRGITHRDIKLTNILISSQGTAKLVDFGLAKMYSSMGNADEKVERTVDYAGLEKATSVAPGDTRSDIFFLGCVLYELLAGRPPMPLTRDRAARMQKQRFDHIPPMKPEEVNAPPAVFRLVETMMSLDPQQRYQTPSQLLEAIRATQRELESKATGPAAIPTTCSLFIVENDGRLQDALRGKFKELGYRVFLAADPRRALERYRQMPFDALLVDAGTTGTDGQMVFETILADAERQGLRFAGILLLNEDQTEVASELVSKPNVAVMIRPLTLRQVYLKMKELAPLKPR
jgi:tRNA A-37 threonylcarbamoyl transferase component Bud32/CheY-like chemotaxis protein